MFSRNCRLWGPPPQLPVGGRNGYRSEVSYDWRGGRSFGADGRLVDVGRLALFHATNIRDVVAPPWWGASLLGDGNKLISCVETALLLKTGHGCIREPSAATAHVFAGMLGIVSASAEAALERKQADVDTLIDRWGETAEPPSLSGSQLTINVPAGAEIVAVGEWGTGDSVGASTLECVGFDLVASNRAVRVLDGWTAHSYVVFWRIVGRRAIRTSRVRLLPFANRPEYTANVTGSVRLVGVENP